MSQPAADRNLLFGVLALQLDFITREQLLAAMQAWVFDKSKSLGEILLGQKALAADNRELLDALVLKHLAQHGNDAEKSLSAISSINDVKTDLLNIADPDLQTSLSHVSASGPKTEYDPYATIAPTAGKPGAEPGSSLTAPSTSGVRFRILRPHARGGLGEVSVARDEELNREVALKEILGRHADNQESRARFMLEAEITGGLEHPGIVPVYGLGTYGDGRPYYAMRFIRGDSLKDAAERFHKADAAGMEPGQRTLELRGLLGRFVDVCNAIHYAHNRGILHRDLKPGNIMLGKYGETLVVDWGLAKPLDEPPKQSESTERLEPGEGSLRPSSSTASETIEGSAVGTPQYMSPEQAFGRLDQLSPASDVYSLGATLYFVLTGRPPMTDRDVHDVIQKVQQGDFPKPRAVKESAPAALEAICLKAMALKPENRYGSARMLADDIEHWLADEPVSAWPEPWTVKARRWIGRHRTLVTSSSAGVLVALVAAIILAVVQTNAKREEARLKEKAEENFQLARGAVNRYLAAVEDDDVLKDPEFKPLKRKLLEAAGEYTQKFVELRRDDPTLKVELAVATFQLGQVTGELDSEIKAIELHEKAAKLLEALPADKAGETKTELATCYHHLGRLNRLADRIAKSEESYKQAIKVWDKLLEDQPKKAKFRDGLARSELGLGNLYQLLNQRDLAQKAYQKAIDIWEDLHKTDDKATSYRRELAVARNNMGTTFKRQVGKQVEAKKWFDAAKPLQLQLVREAPKVIQYQNDLAKTEFNLGETKEAANRWKALVEKYPKVTEPHRVLAEAYVQLANSPGTKLEQSAELTAKAVAMNRKLADSRKNVPSYQGDLGRGLAALGYVHAAREQFDKAEADFAEAIGIQNKVVSEVGKVLHYQRDLANSYTGQGLALALNKKFDKAGNSYQKAVDLWESLLKDHDDESDYRNGFTFTCAQFASVASANKKPEQAAALYAKALARTADSAKPPMRLARATELARAGKYQEAAKEADELVAKANSGNDFYRFARIYSLCAIAATVDGKKAQADTYAQRAVKLLESAFDQAAFRTPVNRERLKVDPDLEILRERADFKKLLSKLDAK